MSRALLIAAIGWCGFADAPALAQGQPGGTPPPPPSNEGTNNPYSAPRNNDAGDALYLSPADAARKAVRDAANTSGKKGARVAAEAADVVAGRDVRDKRGKGIGLIESVAPDGAVVVTELGKVKVPLEAFGKDGMGLMLDLTKGEFDKLVAEATAAG